MKLLRYGRLSMSSQVGSERFPCNSLSSRRNLSWTSGLLVISYTHHDTVLAVVSCPPARRSKSYGYKGSG